MTFRFLNYIFLFIFLLIILLEISDLERKFYTPKEISEYMKGNWKYFRMYNLFFVLTQKFPNSLHNGMFLLMVLGMIGWTAYKGLLAICMPRRWLLLVYAYAASGAVVQIVANLQKKAGCYVMGRTRNKEKVSKKPHQIQLIGE